MELALELRTVSGKKQYGYLKKPLKDMVDSIVDELEKMPEVAAYYSVWNDLRDTLEGYYKSIVPVSTIRYPSKKSSVPSRTPSFRKRSVCGFNSKNLLHRLLQIRRLQVKMLRL